MSKKIKLKKISSSHENLRTPEVIGELSSPIKIGEPIIMTAPPLDPSKDIRSIETTPVQKIKGSLHYTKNSVYEVTYL